MANSKTTLSIAILLGATLLAGGAFLYPTSSELKAKQAPLDPAVTAGVRQARALQKAGKLKEAFVELERHVQLGHPTAMFFLAKAYMSGWGVKPDLEEARKLLQRAVQYQFDFRGESAYKLGRLYEQSTGENCQTIAVAWFRKALEWHYSKAHRQLGIHYEQGLGVEQNIDKAIHHYEQAAKAGYETISLRLARSLMLGRYGLSIDKQRAQLLANSAITAYEVKAANGSGTAAKVLGRLYRDGEFVNQNTQKAAYWLRRASLLGDPGGMHELALLIINKGDDAASEALGWLKQASKLGHGGAMTTLGRLHLEEQHGLPKQKAVSWFQKGVKAGHGGAMEELARLTMEGLLVPKDIPKAINLARQGARLGHRGSRTLLKALLATDKKHNSSNTQTS
jgi:TPR repeat protein